MARLTATMHIEWLGDIRQEWCDACAKPSMLVADYALYGPGVPLHAHTQRQCQDCGATDTECLRPLIPEREQ